MKANDTEPLIDQMRRALTNEDGSPNWGGLLLIPRTQLSEAVDAMWKLDAERPMEAEGH